MTAASTRQGVDFALAANRFRGIEPVYFKWVGHVSPWEILGHGIFWAAVLLIAILFWPGKLGEFRIPVRRISQLILTAGLLPINWLVRIYIYAIVNDNIAPFSGQQSPSRQPASWCSYLQH